MPLEMENGSVAKMLEKIENLILVAGYEEKKGSHQPGSIAIISSSNVGICVEHHLLEVISLRFGSGTLRRLISAGFIDDGPVMRVEPPINMPYDQIDASFGSLEILGRHLSSGRWITIPIQDDQSHVICAASYRRAHGFSTYCRFLLEWSLSFSYLSYSYGCEENHWKVNYGCEVGGGSQN
ncbi:hypothetical protein SAY86_006516 [Trapa natans]|uniref:Uncharacterized protein n=1 Tax=Trapa natans TaxID=22666 RepID=A0AAN7L9W7_TRANT|nr:hypothetical protein SAY86_006516 [Trapa natans]